MKGFVVFYKNLCLYFESRKDLDEWAGEKIEYVDYFPYDLDQRVSGEILSASIKEREREEKVNR